MIPLLAFLQLQQSTPAAGPRPYWQQRVVYQISARLDEPTQTLSGDERVRYFNHSPDTLHTISFHLYLNAFRPGSRWSDADSVEQRRRFNDLKDPDYGFNHVRNVKVDGAAVQPVYPFGRDSTIVRFTLPRALPPGDSMTVSMDWDARTSIPPRRQGRRGRSYDFAQWYPKVVVYDKYGWEEHALYPAGEFYGEFGDFFVKLDVPKDQVVGATGDTSVRRSGLGKSEQRHPVYIHITIQLVSPHRRDGRAVLIRRYLLPCIDGRRFDSKGTPLGRPRRPQLRHDDVTRLSLRGR